MQSHEYRVVPAPRRGQKAKGARRPEDRFAHAVESEINRMAAEGWEFVRSDTLPQEQKQGWFSRPVTVFQTLLVFRRPRPEAAAQGHSRAAAMPPPVALTPPASIAAPPSRPAPLVPIEAPEPPRAAPPVLVDPLPEPRREPRLAAE